MSKECFVFYCLTDKVLVSALQTIDKYINENKVKIDAYFANKPDEHEDLLPINIDFKGKTVKECFDAFVEKLEGMTLKLDELFENKLKKHDIIHCDNDKS